MNKKISLGAAIAYMAIVAAVVFVLSMLYSRLDFNRTIRDLNQREALYGAISELDQYARGSFYGEIDEDLLNSATLAGYVAGLGDPYARYLTPKEYENYTKGETAYSGIGVVTEQDADGYMLVTEVYPESPAEAAALRAGDLILSIDGVATNSQDTTYEEMAAQLRGDAGTKVTLGIRQGTADSTVEITRRRVDVPTVRSQLNDGVAYLRISAISGTTSAQLERNIKQVVADGAKAIIFDIRGVESDNMKAVSEMLDILLPRLPIVYTSTSAGEPQELYSSDESEVDLPMVVLADKGTKGASEMFAMALRDCGKGRTVGETTFGKGTLQEAKRLRDGSAVILTTAIYSGPAGESYDQVGVPADYEVKLGVDDENKANVLGIYDLDAQYRKAQEVAVAAQKTVENAASGSSSAS